MKTNFKTHSILALIACIFTVLTSKGQTNGANYCTPNFSSGCTNWRTINILVQNLAWSQETPANCQASNFLNDTIYMNPGGSYSVEITNANWCGTGVWVDFDQDFGLDTSDNVFHQYLANETNIYQFNLSIPETMQPGIYRFRVVSGWGTDCYNQSNNGFGPCGNYQYGNFQDFSLKILEPTAVLPTRKTENDWYVVQENDALRMVSTFLSDHSHTPTIWNTQGKQMGYFQPTSEGWQFSAKNLPPGIYMIDGGQKGDLKKIMVTR